MEIGSAQSVNANAPLPTQRNDRAERAESETEQPQSTSTGQATQTAEAPPTQRVQPAAENEASQATGNTPPEPETGSQEAVGRFIDTVV